MTRVATPANEFVLVHVARHGTAAHVEKLARKSQVGRSGATRRSSRSGSTSNGSVSYFFDIDDEVHSERPLAAGGRCGRSQGARDKPSRRCGSHSVSRTIFPRKLRCRFRRMRGVPMRCATSRSCSSRTTVKPTGAGSNCRSLSSRRAHRSGRPRRSNKPPRTSEPHQCELEDGPALALDTARRLACDSDGRRYRGRRGWRAARHWPQDPQHSCRHEPCTTERAMAAAVSQGAIARASARGTTSSTGRRTAGKRSLITWITLCGLHRRLVHEGGYGLRAHRRRPYSSSRGPTARRVGQMACNVSAETFWRPSSTNYGGFENSLRAHLKRHEPGLSITAETSRCRWHGETDGLQSSHRVDAGSRAQRGSAGAVARLTAGGDATGGGALAGRAETPQRVARARRPDEEQRNEQHGDEGRREHPADDAGADRVAARGARARC